MEAHGFQERLSKKIVEILKKDSAIVQSKSWECLMEQNRETVSKIQHRYILDSLSRKNMKPRHRIILCDDVTQPSIKRSKAER